MGAMNRLDEKIKERCAYRPADEDIYGDPLPAINEESYTLFRDEINEHIQGRITFEQLSPVAQDLVAQWEGEEEARNSAPYEDSENFHEYEENIDQTEV